MEWWIALLVVVALGIAAAAAVGGMGEMAKDPVRDVYRQDLPLRPLRAGDVDTIRFGITLRGYAMGQVDDLLDRLGAELAERDALIAELTGADPVKLLEDRRNAPIIQPEQPTVAEPQPEPQPELQPEPQPELQSEPQPELQYEPLPEPVPTRSDEQPARP